MAVNNDNNNNNNNRGVEFIDFRGREKENRVVFRGGEGEEEKEEEEEDVAIVV
jgi:hypothetical protein